MPKKHL